MKTLYKQQRNRWKKTGIIFAHDKGRVYMEPVISKVMSATDVRDKYQIGNGRGRHYVEFDVEERLVEWVKNPRYGTPEMTVKGDVRIKNAKFTRRKK